MYEFTGTVQEVCAVQTFTSGFTKRELIVVEDGRREWPMKVPFNFKRDNIPLLDGVKPGDRVKVGFLLDGREWVDSRTNKTRHFCDLVGMSVTVLASAKASATAGAAVPTGAAEAAAASATTGTDDSDIPF